MVKYGFLFVFVIGCSGQDPVSTEVVEPVAKMTVSQTQVGGIKEVRAHVVRERPQLKFDAPLTVNGLQITWLEVQDSRCPDGAVCIWEGEVIAQIQVSAGGEDLGTFALTLNQADKGKAQVRVGGYFIRLVAIEPYPQLDVVTPRDSYAAHLTIDRRGALVVSEQTAGGYRGPLPPTRPVEPRPDIPGKTDHSALAQTLAENRTKWNELGAANYQFNFARSCFCLRDYTREAVVQVANGAIVAATYADDGVAVAADLNDRYDTIDEIFALLAAAVAAGAVQIDVEFDPVLGYPTSLYIDHDRRIADEEQSIAASGVVLNP